jgi:hypothetical protein
MFRPSHGEELASFEDDGRPTDSEGEMAKATLQRKLSGAGASEMVRRTNLGLDYEDGQVHGGS